MHIHDCYELVYYHSGAGTTCLADKSHTYNKHSYTIITPSTLHDEQRLQDTEVTFVGFTLLDKHFSVISNSLYEELASNPSLERLLVAMNAEMNAKHAFYAQKLNLLLGEILIEHMRLTEEKSAVPLDETLFYARKYMDENYSQKITIDDLSQIAGYSYDHFRHLFKMQFGISPFAYIMGKRLDRASILLRNTSLSVTSITMSAASLTIRNFAIFLKENLVKPLCPIEKITCKTIAAS